MSCCVCVDREAPQTFIVSPKPPLYAACSLSPPTHTSAACFYHVFTLLLPDNPPLLPGSLVWRPERDEARDHAAVDKQWVLQEKERCMDQPHCLARSKLPGRGGVRSCVRGGVRPQGKLEGGLRVCEVAATWLAHLDTVGVWVCGRTVWTAVCDDCDWLAGWLLRGCGVSVRTEQLVHLRRLHSCRMDSFLMVHVTDGSTIMLQLPCWGLCSTRRTSALQASLEAVWYGPCVGYWPSCARITSTGQSPLPTHPQHHPSSHHQRPPCPLTHVLLLPLYCTLCRTLLHLAMLCRVARCPVEHPWAPEGLGLC